MKMRVCPFCAEQAKAVALACPHCTRDLPPLPPELPTKHNPALFWVLVALMVFVSIVILVLVLMGVG
jgi:hypothetical protein